MWKEGLLRLKANPHNIRLFVSYLFVLQMRKLELREDKLQPKVTLVASGARIRIQNCLALKPMLFS